jgi:hypothetical protein
VFYIVLYGSMAVNYLCYPETTTQPFFQVKNNNMGENLNAEGKTSDIKFQRNLWHFTKCGFFRCE